VICISCAMSFVGGKLKLKGGEPEGIKKKKKKKDKEKDAAAMALTTTDSKQEQEAEAGSTREGYAIKPKEGEDRRTEAERKFDDRVRKLEEERIRKLAQKSHKDRIKEFNEKLANLSEHHDIPKVGPG
jgi:protein FAM32A